MADGLTPQQLDFVETFIGGGPAGEAPDVTALADHFLDGKAEAAKSVDKLRGVLAKSDDPDTVRIADFGLDGLTDGNSVALMAALRELGSAAPGARGKAAGKVASCCSAYRSFLSGDPIIAMCEDNPFVSGVRIVAPLTAALDRIESGLAALNR